MYFFIIFLMAGIAILVQFFLIYFALMTGLAFHLDVFILQRVFRIFVMIKNKRFPIFFLVARLALGAKITFMFVINLVAADTSGCYLFFLPGQY